MKVVSRIQPSLPRQFASLLIISNDSGNSGEKWGVITQYPFTRIPMKLKGLAFIIVSFLLLASGDLYAQASSQREVRITNPTNSNYISFLSPSGVNAPPATYSLILPSTVNPSGTSLLFGTGTGSLTWTSGGANGQVLTISGGIPTWVTPSAAGNYVNYDVTSQQGVSTAHGNNLFNVAYAAGATGATAAGAVINSSVGAISNATATGLTVTATGSGSGTSTGLSVSATGGTTNTGITSSGTSIGVAASGNTAVTATGTTTGVAATGVTAVSAIGSTTGIIATGPTAVAATGNVNLLSAAGVASTLSLQNPAGTFATSFVSGAQTAAIGYTLPTAAPAANAIMYSSGGANSTLTWTAAGSNGQVLTLNAGVPSWQTPASAGNYVNYDVTSAQSTAAARTDNLFNVAYSAGAAGGVAAGAVITSSVGAGTNVSATGLTVSSTANGSGTATGIAVSAASGTTNNAIDATGNINILSAGGTAYTLGLQNPAGTFSTKFAAGAQTADITYTLPSASPSTGSLLYSSGGASSTLTWAPSGTDGQFLQLSSGVPVWGNAVMYDVTSAQSTMLNRTHNLFNVAYNGSASDADAAGAVITSVAGPTNGTATGLTITSTGTGLGNATGLSVTANGGTVKTAIAATGNVNILSAGGSANTLGLQNPAGTFTSYIKAAAQSADITYTLPTALPAANGYALTANTTGVLSWSAVSGGSGSGWLTTGNSGLVDNTSNYLGTLDNTPIRFVAGTTGSPSTKMVLDQTGDILLGSNSGTTTFTSATGRMAIGDALSTTRLNSVPTIGTNVFNMIDANAGLRVWRFATNAGNSDPAIDLIGGVNDNQGNVANQWWTISSTGTPGTAGSGTNSTGEHLTFRRRSGSVDSEFVSIFAGGNVGIGGNGSGVVTAPANRLTVTTTDAGTNSTTDVLAIQHNSSGTAANSFGTGMVFRGESSTTNNRDMAAIRSLWTNATDASRTSALTFSTDTSTSTSPTEKMRIAGNGYIGVNATDPGVRVDINGGYATRSNTVTLSNGVNNDVPVGDCAFLRILGPTAGFTITGLQAGVDGQRLRIANITGRDMTIADSSSLSALGNRIETNTNSDIIVKGPVPILDMTYDGATAQWLLGTLNANQIIGGIGSIMYVYKTADETVTNSAVLQNDDHLQFSMAAGQTWEIGGELLAYDVGYANNANFGMNMAFTVPTGSILRIYYTGIQDAGGNAILGNGVLNTSGTAGTVEIKPANNALITFRGIVITGSNAGTVQFKWCQNSANATGTRLTQYSYMRFTRIN